MFVAFDYQAFSLQRRGGVSRYIWELARGIHQTAGHRSLIVCPWSCSDYLLRSDVPVFSIANGHFRGASKLRTFVNRSVSSARFGKTAFDVLHETFYEERSWYRGKAARVLTVHDMIHEIFPADFPAASDDIRRKRAAVSRADHVICVSDNSRRDLLANSIIDPAKVSVVHHGVSLSAHEEMPQGAIPDRPFVLFVGARAAYKNFEMLLSAFAASPVARSECAIVCVGGPPLSAGELVLARSLGLRDKEVIQVTDPRDCALRWLYARARCLIYPSKYEGFGFPPLEAMLAGCPVGCSNTSSLPEIAGDAALLFDPGDVDSIRSALESLVTSSDLRNELVRKGKRQAAKFSWLDCITNTLSAYRAAL